MTRPARFWGAALAAAAAFALGALWLLPYEALGLQALAQRQRAWLLTLWTGGVLAVLFGVSGLLGASGGLGFRDVAEAGSVAAALQRQRQRAVGAPGFHGNFAWWLVSVGALLLLTYFAAWWVLGTP